VILILYIDVDFSPFQRYDLDEEGWDLFALALGRFVAFFLIWTNAIGDLQNAINLILCTKGCDRVLGTFQLLVVMAYPFAFVCAIVDSEDFKGALTATGILAMFLKLDETLSSILDLGLLKREIGELVHTINNPLASGVRETIMNFAIMTYTCGTFFYVWIVALGLYPVDIILWFGFTIFFFRAFYNDMKDAKSVFERIDLMDHVRSALNIDGRDSTNNGVDRSMGDDDVQKDLGEFKRSNL